MGISKKHSNSGLRVGKGVGHLPPPLLCSNALRVLSGASHQRMSPPQACERLCISPAYAGSETEHASPEIYPEGSCKGNGIWHHLLFCLAFQYSIPVCGQPPTPTGVPPWLPRRALSCEWSLPWV